MKRKVCPICKVEKSVAKDFQKYFSHERGKYRVQNYCNDCQKIEKTRRSKEYYERNKEKRKQYARDYRRNPKNKAKRLKIERYFRKKYRTELQDCYVASALAQKWKTTSTAIRAVPGLLEGYKAKLMLVREIRKHEKGKENLWQRKSKTSGNHCSTRSTSSKPASSTSKKRKRSQASRR